MRKKLKVALVTIVLAAIVLCFAGCGGGAGGNPVDNGGRNSGSEADGRQLNGYEGCLVDNDDESSASISRYNDKNALESIDLQVFWSDYEYDIAIIYNDYSLSDLSFMSKAYLGELEYPDYSDFSYMDGWFGWQNLSKDQVYAKLPEEGPVNCYVQSASDPDKNVYCTFTQDQISKLRNWILAHE